jgi:hypothetical protein
VPRLFEFAGIVGLLGSSGLACQPIQRALISPPDDVQAFAELALAGDRTIFWISPLAKSPDALPPLVEKSAELLWVIGFSARDLPSDGLPSDEVLAADPLSLAGACGVSLPPPSFGVSLSEKDRESELDLSMVPRLTAEWLEASCPPTQMVAIDAGCPQQCDPKLVQHGCRATLDLSLCGEAPIELLFDRSGRACDPTGRCTIQPADASQSGAAWDVSCLLTRARCEMIVHRDPPSHPIQVELRSVGLPPMIPGRLPPEEAIDSLDAHNGYFSELARLPHAGAHGEIVVAGLRSQLGLCTVESPTVLWFFDDSDLSLIRSSTTVPCLMVIAPDVEPYDGFVGAFGSQAGPTPMSVGRFDASGRLLSSVPIPLPPPPATLRYVFSNADPAITEPGRLVFPINLLWPPDVMPDRRGQHDFLAEIDHRGPNLSATATPIPIDQCETVGLTLFEGALWLADDVLDRVVALAPDRGSLTATITFPIVRPAGYSGLAAPPGSRHGALLRAKRIYRGLTDVEPEAPGSRMTRLFGGLTPTAVGPWAAAPNLWAVFGTAHDARGGAEPALTFFDPVTWRFLPESHPLDDPSGTRAFGTVSRIRDGGNGRLLMLLPWSGQLGRVSAR